VDNTYEDQTHNTISPMVVSPKVLHENDYRNSYSSSVFSTDKEAKDIEYVYFEDVDQDQS